MGDNTIPAGSELIDGLLDGGYEVDTITTIYGPAGSGKTTFCLLCMIDIIEKGKKVIFIDSEGGFSVTRLGQLTKNCQDVLDKVIFLRPTNFEEQKKVFENLKEAVTEKTGLIIVDTISMLYRLELANEENAQNANRELSKQISILNEIARKKNIAVVVTSPVYSDFDHRDRVNLVGGDILKYGSKCLIEIQKLHKNKRKAILKKHRSLPEGKEAMFEIVQEGIKKI